MTLEWNELDQRAVNMAKVLSGDAVEKAGSGHPGTPISLAAAAYLLYQRHLRFDPQDSDWLGRDRFVLSAGHASLLQYLQLYLAGQSMELEDLKKFRTFNSYTPGHPEYRHTKGVEVTTGPLGSGFAAAVGFAMASRRAHGMLDPDTPLGKSPFDHNVYVIAGDGCLQEGISGEASSLAGVQDLGNLIVIWDDNHISIEDDTDVSFQEDVLKRYESYGWHTQRVNWLQEDGSYREDVDALDQAINVAKAEKHRPSIIALRTIIGWPSPTMQNTGAIHGAKLGEEELKGLKEALGLDPEKMFAVDQEALQHARDNAAARARAAHGDWDPRFEQWKQTNPDKNQLLERILAGKLPEGIEEALPVFSAGESLATRAASGKVISAIGAVMPEYWGGSADLAGSNNTTIAGAPSFIPESAQTDMWKGNPFGRVLHFGVREHGMGGIMNGIAIDGLTRVFGGTFFVFSDYMRGAVRLAALMNIPVTYVWTHDSIGVGEDGPTHQPVEHLSAYRAIPNLAMVRPMDANETAAAWLAILRQHGPAGLVLTRQALPVYQREDMEGSGADALASAKNVSKGAYVLADSEGEPEVILLASGSEVQYALEARAALAKESIAARVVSVPCMEWFKAQDAAYREQVLPSAVKARVSIEAGLVDPWRDLVGDNGESIGLDDFGLPGAAAELFAHYGLDSEHVVAAAKRSVARVRS
ncbi:transketolase [uncultured Varibaculum sp.]|uniref:transketolase n=1 Tax=uncultured Varibaculum sp. TaxID=413896 RepID=UPI002595373A|nr:transketolase [uncultured Varibaculum sp.]